VDTLLVFAMAHMAEWLRVWSFDELRMTEFLGGYLYCLADPIKFIGDASGPSTTPKQVRLLRMTEFFVWLSLLLGGADKVYW
jgi:hypothetical protein